MKKKNAKSRLATRINKSLEKFYHFLKSWEKNPLIKLIALFITIFGALGSFSLIQKCTVLENKGSIQSQVIQQGIVNNVQYSLSRASFGGRNKLQIPSSDPLKWEKMSVSDSIELLGLLRINSSVTKFFEVLGPPSRSYELNFKRGNNSTAEFDDYVFVNKFAIVECINNVLGNVEYFSLTSRVQNSELKLPTYVQYGEKGEYFVQYLKDLKYDMLGKLSTDQTIVNLSSKFIEYAENSYFGFPGNYHYYKFGSNPLGFKDYQLEADLGHSQTSSAPKGDLQG